MIGAFLRRCLSSRNSASMLWLLLAAAFVVGPARATVELRVEARPISDPIQAFVTVTDTNGDPVPALTSADFTVTVDGVAVVLQPGDVVLPPAQDPNQKVSVVFAMDYTSSITPEQRTAMEGSVIAFIDAMNLGDFAAILKFNNDSGANVVQGFIEIDDGGPNDVQLAAAVSADYPGDGSNILDAAQLAVEEFANQSTLPAGPKAVILVTDGIETHSVASAGDVIDIANDNGIPIFAIDVGDQSDQDAVDLLTELATETGGEYIPAPDDVDIVEAYASISALLGNEYLVSIESDIADCEQHVLAVEVEPHGSDEATFTRRDCDTAPDAFTFTSVTDVDPSTGIRSNTVTISGLEAPAAIGVTGGSYGIGCGDGSTFTTADGTISDGETVCVRQTTSGQFSTEKDTTLTVGGVSATFTTTTSAAPPAPPPPPGGGGGGGGASGILELLLGLAAWFARRRLPA